MPAAWQKWMPLHIDKLWSSPEVQRMHGWAFKGYMALITAQWQSDDCSLTDSVEELAIISRLSDEQWAEHSQSILRKFPSAEEGGLRNSTCYEQWMEAKARYEEGKLSYEQLRETRREAGKYGAEKKWGDRPKSSAVRSERLTAARERGRHTTEQWNLLLAFCGDACLRCDVRGKLVKDHIRPIYQGGSDSIENIQPLCSSCNSSKGPEDKDYRPSGWQNACQMPGKQKETPSKCTAIGGLTDTETYTNTKEQILLASSPSGDSAETLFVELPTNRRNLRFPVYETHILDWIALYPAVDARQQVRNMRGWLDGNPEHRKTLKGTPAFIHRWLSKAQDKGGSVGTQPSGTNGSRLVSPASQRVESGVNAFREAGQRLGITAARGANGPDGEPLSPSGHRAGSGELPVRHAALADEVRVQGGGDGASDFAHQAKPEILPPPDRSSRGVRGYE